MRERPQSKITAEQGWAQLQPKLDEAMPVERRSRRFLFFWWTTVAIGIAILTSFMFMKESVQPVHAKETVAPTSSIASHGIQSSSTESLADNNISVTTNEKSPLISGRVENLKDENDLHPRHSTITTQKSDLSTVKSAAMFKPVKNQDLTSEVDQTTDINPTKDATLYLENINVNTTEFPNKPVTSNADDIIAGVDEAGTIRSRINQIEFLPLVNVYERKSSIAPIEDIQPGYVINSQQHHALSPHIIAGAMTGSQNGLGLNVGVGADYAINTKLSLTGQLGVSSYRPGLLNNKNKELTSYDPIISNDNNYAETYIVADKVNTATDYNAIIPYIKSIRQWEVRAGMKYSLTKRFFIEGGIGLGFGTRAKSEYPIVTFLPNTSSPTNTNVGTFFNPFNIVRSNLTTLYGGIGFHMSRHLSISMAWSQGLNHYLLNDQSSSLGVDVNLQKRTDYIRGVQVGVKYQL